MAYTRKATGAACVRKGEVDDEMLKKWLRSNCIVGTGKDSFDAKQMMRTPACPGCFPLAYLLPELSH
eukprot:1160555-Pelagomonas_calceolata.AAC.4